MFEPPTTPRATIRCMAALLCLAVFGSCASAAQKERREDVVSSMTELVERYAIDRRALQSFYEIEVSTTRLERLDAFDREWEAQLAVVDFDGLGRPDQIDHVLLRRELERERGLRERLRERLGRTTELLPFADAIIELEESRWDVDPVDPRNTAEALNALADSVREVRERVERGRKPAEAEPGGMVEETSPLEVSSVDALWVARRLEGLQSALERWFRHYDRFLPGFSWWNAEPHRAAKEALEDYARFLREEVAGQKGEEDDPLVGDPIGRDALLADIAHEMLPYAPEEIIAIGEAEFAWCEDEMRRAAGELGFGDDWKAALEHVKGLHVEPGEQDALVARQAREAIAFLDEHDLVTVPELCRETWRVRMLSKEGQRTLPFAAYGGQVMLVAFPTSDMDHESKLMAMRGNNIHFTRAITPHELIPGHHLQSFMAQRHATHRRIFGTPFLSEGWALYWEMVEWDRGWPRGPEDRIGMLFWRMHRAARIIVSLGFHLERMSPEEMIDFLVERVGHERDGATSEVRRFIGGGYGPLYQCAYMIGALQLRSLHGELVGSGRMSDREFHDAVLRLNSMPIEMIRFALTEEPLASDHESSWFFAGDVEPSEAFLPEPEDEGR